MNKPETFRLARIRLLVFAVVAALHIVIIMFVAVRMETAVSEAEPVAGVMKLVDVEEEPPPPPPPEEPPLTPETTTQEAVAETMIETEEEPPPVTSVQPPRETVTEQIEYLPQHRISVLPVLPEADIRRNIVYPPIAQRSGIEGIVYLELFMDRQGNIRNIRVLKEDPPGRGFGEAAVNAFRGITGKPGEANGEAVAVRFRKPIRFQLN